MTRITIISCIIAAVCVFQTAEAGVFDKLLEKSPLQDMQKQVSNTLGSMKEMGNEKWGNHGLKVVKGNPMACTDMYNRTQEVMNQVTLSFQRCFFNETGSAVDNVAKLTNATYKLQEDLSKNFQNTLKCFKNFLNPVAMFKCFSNMSQNVSKLIEEFKEVMMAALDLMKMFPNVGVCYSKAINQVSEQGGLNKLAEDGKQCIKSVMPFPF